MSETLHMITKPLKIRGRTILLRKEKSREEKSHRRGRCPKEGAKIGATIWRTLMLAIR